MAKKENEALCFDLVKNIANSRTEFPRCEINLASWRKENEGGKVPKIDIRTWWIGNDGVKTAGRGISLNREDLLWLVEQTAGIVADDELMAQIRERPVPSAVPEKAMNKAELQAENAELKKLLAEQTTVQGALIKEMAEIKAMFLAQKPKAKSAK